MSEPFKPTTPPNTSERLREIDEWMADQNQAAVDKLIVDIHRSSMRIRTKIVEALGSILDEPEPTPQHDREADR